MAKFPIKRAKRLPPAVGPSVRADIDVRTGGRAIGGAIAGLGGAISGVGERRRREQKAEQEELERITEYRQRLQDTRSSITADSLTTTAISENLAFREINADTTTWSPDLRDRLNTANSEIGELSMSEDIRELLFVKFQARSREALAKSLIAETRREVEDTQAAAVIAYVDAVESGDEILIKDATRNFDDSFVGIVDEAERREIHKQATLEGLKRRKIKDIDAVLEGALSNRTPTGDIDLEAANKFIDNSDLAATRKASLKTTINEQKRREQQQKDRKEVELQEATQSEILLDIYEGVVDVKEIELCIGRGLILDAEGIQSLTPSQAESLYGSLKRSLTKEPEKFATDPEVEARVLRDLFDPTKKITESDILYLVGRGLSVATARKFISDLDIFTDPWFRRIDMFLKSQLGWDGAYEKFAHPDGGLSYKLASDKLFDAIATKKLRGRDIYDEGTVIAIPFIISYWQNVLEVGKPEIERMKAMLLKGEVAPETEIEKPTPVKKRDVIDPKGIWQ